MSINQSEPDHCTGDMLQNALEIRHAARLMTRVCAMISEGTFQAGDRIPPERELARRIRISLAGVRTGIAYLAMIGVLKVKQGTGAFVAMGAEELAGSELAQDQSQEGWDLNCICEARAVLEGNLAALAAERRNGKHWVKLAEELTELFAAADDPGVFLIHEMAFHRTLAQAAGNPILCALMTRLNAAIYDAYRQDESSNEELHNSANRYRRIFRAIRNREPDEARKAMEDHLRIAKNPRRKNLSEETGRMAGQSP